MNKKLASFIGLLLSDGSIYYDKSKRTYCIQLTSKFSSMRNYFRYIASDLFGVENFHENVCSNAISLRFFSVKIAEFLFSFSPTYKTIQYPDETYPDCKVPNEIKASKLFCAEFLKAFSSCDGNFYYNPKKSIRYIEIRCYHPKLKIDIIECLNNLGITCSEKTNSIIISNMSNLNLFRDRIGFLSESFVADTNSKHFGISKMKILVDALH